MCVSVGTSRSTKWRAHTRARHDTWQSAVNFGGLPIIGDGARKHLIVGSQQTPIDRENAHYRKENCYVTVLPKAHLSRYNESMENGTVETEDHKKQTCGTSLIHIVMDAVFSFIGMNVEIMLILIGVVFTMYCMTSFYSANASYVASRTSVQAYPVKNTTDRPITAAEPTAESCSKKRMNGSNAH